MRAGARSFAKLAFAALLLLWVYSPWTSFSLLGTANLALQYTMVAVSLVLLTGWVGQISMAQAAFVGIGAFTTGVLVRNWGVPFPLTAPLAAAAAAGAAALLGLVALRVRGLYLAVATLIFAWMAQSYLFNQPWFAGIGGSSTAQIDPLGRDGSLPYFDFADRRTFYFVMLAATVAAIYAAANLRDSKTGRAWFAVRGSEVAAASLGVDVTAAKLMAFATSGFLAGLAGALVMTHEQVVTGGAFAIQVSFFYLAIAVVGGLQSLGGAVAGGVLFASLEEVFFRVDVLAGWLDVVSALLLAFVLLFFPAGLAGIPERFRVLGDRIWPPDRRESLRELRRRLLPTRREAETVIAEAEERARAERGPAEHALASGRSGRLARWGALLARSGAGHATVKAPDVLRTSLETAELERARQAEAPSGLTWEPGIASKVRLPARSRRAPVLAARDITVQFGGLRAVDNATLEVREGEIVGLIGPNGAGKTTMFNAISGLNEPTAGTVELFGTDVTSVPVHQRARLGMGRTFQVIQLFPHLSVFDNLLVATHTRNPTGYWSHLWVNSTAVVEEAEARRRVRQVVELLGLEEVVDRRVAGLPFGTLRLVEIARALVTGSPFVMLDEPASGLDNAETDRFIDLLFWIRQTLGVSILVIEHDVRMVTTVCDYMYVLDRGVMIANGTPSRVRRNPKVVAAYLGEVGSNEGARAEARRG